MAKKIGKKPVLSEGLKPRNNDITKPIKQEIAKISKQIETIALFSVFVAQNTLKDVATTDHHFTQKHGAELITYINLKQEKENVYKVVAGENADNEIRYELFYAEYGAGIDATAPPFGDYPYLSKGAANKYGFWYYPLVEPTITGKKYASTKRSTPAKYMQTARNFARQQLKALKPNIVKSIKTSIKKGVRNVFET